MDDIEIVSAVLELETSAERRRYLDQACRENAAMRNRLEGLLQSFHEAGQFLACSPTVGLTAKHRSHSGFPNTLGDEIGPYKLRKLLGEGGMGIVYEAVQEHPIHRTVALKIIKLGMDSSEVLRRFEAERQVLSVVDHPHIAKAPTCKLISPASFAYFPLAPGSTWHSAAIVCEQTMAFAPALSGKS